MMSPAAAEIMKIEKTSKGKEPMARATMAGIKPVTMPGIKPPNT